MRLWAVLVLLATFVVAAPARVEAEEVHWQHVTSEAIPDQTTVQGEIETWPVDGGLQVRGWVVDGFSATRPDRILVTGLSGVTLGHVESGGFERRQDVEMRFGSSAYALSGFALMLPGQPRTLVVRAHLGQLGWWWAGVTITTSPRLAVVVREECVGTDVVEIEIRSPDVFPVRNAILELHVGSVTSGLSRYGDNGDLHSVIFLLTPDQLAQVGETDVAYVGFTPGGPDEAWQVGTIDTSAAICMSS